MVEAKDVVLALFGATSALSALVLVFLALIAGGLGSFRPGASAKVKRPYKVAAAVAFASFLVGVACAALSTWWLVSHQPHRVYLAVVVAFVVQLVLLTLASAQVAIQMIFRQ
jgi:hypothetical protein